MTGPMLDRLEVICRSTAAKWECEVLEFNGEADHVHLLLALTPKMLPSAFVNNLKTVTSRLLRKEGALKNQVQHFLEIMLHGKNLRAVEY
ncbi:Transposase IS200-like protein [mine drainage metagenome]|uniref:Transposase IS200-like protein n=1 Tax=mine drainage metagenome TaxID=410659 RepID=T0Z7S6_9ZZZZ